MQLHRIGAVVLLWVWSGGAALPSRIFSHASKVIRPFHNAVPGRLTGAGCAAHRDPADYAPSIVTKPSIFVRTTAAMALISAPLGMLLDNQHGLFGVLEYAHPLQLTAFGKVVLKTAIWVPALFGFAGFAMSAIVLVLDDLLRTLPRKRAPSWPRVLYGISAFSVQYYVSGLLDAVLREPSGIVTHATLAAMAAAGFDIFDGTVAGFLLAVATAVAGPVTEVLLINVAHLYTYTHADAFGVCSWIPYVYFMGAPAVANLARKVLTTVPRD